MSQTLGHSMNAILGTTKSKELQHFLREQIKQGVYKPADKIPSIRAFAQKYALNKTTVNLAIANLAAEGLLVSQVGKGTLVVKPNKPNSPKIIGYIFDSGISPEYPSIALHIKHLTKTFAENHYSLVADEYPAVGGMCENPDFQEKIRNHFFSGVIAYTSVSLEDIVFLKKHHVPLVIVGEESNDEHTASVCADMFEAGMSLTNHLVKLGHKKIALLTGPAGNKAGELMELGCRAVMVKHDLAYSAEYVMAGPWGEDGGGILAGQIVSLKERPTAIITAEEIMALGVMKKLLALGYRIPEDFSVAGLADRLPVSAYPVPLTVSDTDEQSQIIKAAELLAELMRKNNPNMKIKLCPKLIVRQSCGGAQRPRQSPTPLAGEANACRTRAAFTLIEILVVIAIIGILAALLSPGLKSARDSGRSIACINNLKQIGVAFQLYSNDNGDFLPLGYYFKENPSNPVGWGWQITVGKYLQKTDTPYTQAKIFIDPSISPVPEIYDWSGPWIGYYAVNFEMLERRGNYSNPIQSYPPSEWPHRSLFNRPSEMMLVEDASNFYTSPPDYGYGDSHVFRHKGGLNVLYLDGHCGYVSGPQYPFSRYNVFWSGN